MLKVRTEDKGNIEEILVSYQGKFPLGKISKQVQEDLQEEGSKLGRGKTVPPTIKRRIVDKNTHEIYVGGKNADITGYLIEGTDDHFISPKDKQALSWTDGGGRFFSKGHMVKGIKKLFDFSIKKSLTKINAIVIGFLKNPK